MEKYPVITFKSNSIKKIIKNTFVLTGNLTMHGITRLVSVDLTYVAQVVNPVTKKLTAGFQATSIFKRSDFNLGSSLPVELVKDEILILADGEFIKQ